MYSVHPCLGFSIGFRPLSQQKPKHNIHSYNDNSLCDLYNIELHSSTKCLCLSSDIQSG